MCWRARQLRGRGGHSALLSLKVGGSSLRHCLHKNYYLGGRWGEGGVIGPALLVLYLWLCLLYSMLLVCCRLSKEYTFYLLFLRRDLKKWSAAADNLVTVWVRRSHRTRLQTCLFKAWRPNPLGQLSAEHINYYTQSIACFFLNCYSVDLLLGTERQKA